MQVANSVPERSRSSRTEPELLGTGASPAMTRNAVDKALECCVVPLSNTREEAVHGGRASAAGKLLLSRPDFVFALCAVS